MLGWGWGAEALTQIHASQAETCWAPTFGIWGRDVPSAGPQKHSIRPGSVPLPSRVQQRGAGADKGPYWQGRGCANMTKSEMGTFAVMDTSDLPQS